MIKHTNLLYTYSNEQIVYRYLSLEKFIYMISSNYFMFPRITLFDDIFEGTYPNGYIERCREDMQSYLEQLGLDINRFKPNTPIEETAINWRQNYYISCWHANSFESEAMWRLYSNYNRGIAIVSSIKNLTENFPEYYDNKGFPNPLFIGEVKYLDFNSEGADLFKPGQLFEPCLLKRKSFEHEREIRIYCHIGSGWGNDKSGIEPPIDNDTISFPMDYNKLVQKVIIAPASPDWYSEVIRSICEKFSIQIPIERSEIAGKPIFRFWGNEWFK